ncbi:unnamed protein product [Echinostoma caproni]|uniref:Saposin B-type domain-containing protein n=1 Tax=Echinostoma caproni TaxID=27848 RepID=A0A183ADE1_9TREM|nr:unnamed protein product [Echinostoma caproni]
MLIASSFLVKVTGDLIALSNDKMDEVPVMDACGVVEDAQRSVCAQIDHLFYRDDMRVKSPMYMQCVIRHLMSHLHRVEFEVWLAKQFVRTYCTNQPDDCATRFVQNMFLYPRENPPILPFIVDLNVTKLDIQGTLTLK